MEDGGDLQLDEGLRRRLGLAGGESIRPLRAMGRTLVLERIDGQPRAAVPWDRELVLSADVQSFPLADLLSLVHSAGKSGFLSFTCGKVEKCVYLHRGEVIFASSNQNADRLGECLLRDERITLEQLRETERRFSPSERFGKSLVERGVLTPRELWNGVKAQVEVIVRSLFAYTTGFVHFWEGEVEPDNVVRLALPTRRLIAEGLEQRDDLLRFVAHLEDARVVLRRRDGKRDTLSGNGRAVYDALEDGDRFPALCRRAGFDPLSTARTLMLLKVLDAVEIGTVEADGDRLLVDLDKASADSDVVRGLVVDHVALLSELVAPLVMVDGEAAVRARLGELVSDVARAHPFLDGIEIGGGCVLDPEAVTQRALRIARDREAHVCQALGELVTYIEFELRHHPRLEDAERYVEAVEDLRAKIEH
ncbi:MAG: DUF4388 domain-containing protein [Myxococcota bacterium]